MLTWKQSCRQLCLQLKESTESPGVKQRLRLDRVNIPYRLDQLSAKARIERSQFVLQTRLADGFTG